MFPGNEKDQEILFCHSACWRSLRSHLSVPLGRIVAMVLLGSIGLGLGNVDNSHNSFKAHYERH